MTRHADSHGVRIAWEALGPADADPLVCVHGLGYARRGWGPVIEILARTRRVVLLDNRGIGASEVPPGPYSAAQMAADVLAVMDAAEVGRADVMGTSLGGMVAQELAIARPDRVRRLVLVCTTPGGEGAYPLPEPTMRLLSEAPSLEPAEAMRRFVANALSPEAARERPELIDRLVSMRSADPQDPAGWAGQAAAGVGYDGGGRQADILAPTLIVHGTADTVVDPRNAGVLAERIPDARRAEVAGAGHLLFWERPEEFAALVDRFLSEEAR